MTIRNDVVNPQFFAAVPGSVPVRRNRAIDPLGITGNGWGTYWGPDVTWEPVDDGGDGRQVVLTTHAGQGNPEGLIIASNDHEGIVQGQWLTAMFELKGEAGRVWGISGRGFGHESQGSYQHTCSGEWERVQLQWPIFMPITGDTFGFQVTVDRSSSGYAAEQMRFRRVSLETDIGEQPDTKKPCRPFFCGSTNDDSGIDYYWANGANVSASIALAAVHSQIRTNHAHRTGMTPAEQLLPYVIGGTATAETLSGGPDDMLFTRMTITSAPPSEWRDAARLLLQETSSWTPVLGGDEFTASAWARTSKPGLAVAIRTVYHDANDQFIVDHWSEWGDAARADWRRISRTFTAPAGSAKMYSVVCTLGGDASGSLLVGDHIDATAALVEFGPLRDPFNGHSSPDPSLSPAHLGTPSASPSHLRGIGVAGIHDVQQGLRGWRLPFGGLRVRRFNMSGDRSLLVGPTRPSFAQRTLLLKGTKSAAGGIEVQVAGGSAPVPFSAAEPTEYRLPHQQHAAGFIYVSVPNEIAIGEGFDLEHLFGADGDYRGPYVDGDTIGAHWDGPPHGSASEKPLPALSVWDADAQQERWINISLAG